MRPKDANRQRRLQEYRPIEASREEHAMRYHEQMTRKWAAQAEHLSQLTGRPPEALAMFGEDHFRRMNEERFLIEQVLGPMTTKDMANWSIQPRIGDLYAQKERPRLTKFESIRNPEVPENAFGQHAGFFQSKYYRKRVKELRSFIEKIRPFEVDGEGLVVVGQPIDLDGFQEQPTEVTEELSELTPTTTTHLTPESIVKATMGPTRLFFKTCPGATQSQTVICKNEGTTAVYYEWEIVPDVDLLIGSGADRVSVRRGPDGTDFSEKFDWSGSDAFNLPRNQQPKTRSEFCFTQMTGSIRPGNSISFGFSFKSDVAGCFTEKWAMRVIPAMKPTTVLTVMLRGCCEVEPPSLISFKQSIDESLHESERTRCVDEILGSVFDRVMRVCQLHRQHGEDRIESDVLVDDRAPVFEAANQKWGLKYSPALYASLLTVADRCWDALGISGFDRFWDQSVESLTKMAMRVVAPDVKRDILSEINEIVRRSVTTTAAGNLAYSLAYVQFSTLLEELPTHFIHDAAVNSIELPFFVVPKVQTQADLDQELEAASKKHRKGKDRKPPPKKPPPKKGGKADDDASRVATPNPEAVAEMAAELKIILRARIREELAKKLRIFENLATESRGVGRQLTRVNEIERLDTNLANEVEDDLE
jgi:hypothetical protein